MTARGRHGGSGRRRRRDGAAKLERRVLWQQWTAMLGDDDDGEKEELDRAAGRRRAGGNQENHEVLGEGARKKESYIGGLLSRVEPRPGTKGPFVPGEATTRDKRCFWAGRENSLPAAHL